MTVQIRVIGPQHEVDQALSRIGTVVDLNTRQMTRTAQGRVGRALVNLEGKIADLVGVPAADLALAEDEDADEVVHVTAEPRVR